MHGLLRVPLAGGLLIIVLAAAGPASAQPLQGQPAQTVLVIFSGPESHPSNLALDESIRHALAAPPEIRIDYFAEYLDTDPVPPDQSARELAEFLAMKFQGRRIDVVVAITDAALRFVLDQRQRLFPAVPILFPVCATATVSGRPSLIRVVSTEHFRS